MAEEEWDRLDINYLKDHFLEAATTQVGSRFIQGKLEDEGVDFTILRAEIKNDVVPLMKDAFGNYVIQVLLELDPSFLSMIMNDLKGQMKELSTNKFSCRVVQELILKLSQTQLIELVEELLPSLEMCVFDKNGCHVVQKCIEQTEDEATWIKIVEELSPRTKEMSMKKYSCHVIQKLIECCGSLPQTIEMIECGILPYVNEMTMDQNGNYVIQSIIKSGLKRHKQEVVNSFRKDLFSLVSNKYASNVIEKSITFGNNQQRKDITNEFLKPGDDGSCPLQSLMTNKFANFVIQVLVREVKLPELERIQESIQALQAREKKINGYGKHVIKRVQERMKVLSKK